MQKKPTLSKVGNKVIVQGRWRVDVLAPVFQNLSSQVSQYAKQKEVEWDLSQVAEMDYIGARFLWDAWQEKLPSQIHLAPSQQNFFDRLKKAPSAKEAEVKKYFDPYRFLKDVGIHIREHFIDFVILSGQGILDFLQFLRNPLKGPWKEISANIYNSGTRALGITALVGFLIGVVLSYLSAQQLHQFGGDVFLVNLLGLGVTRELGPLLAAILVAGRSGSSMTAQIGVMRVTEELDAMLVMGLPHGFRLVLPKVLALAIVMPLLVMWTILIAMIGGMLAAKLAIGLSISYFLTALPKAIPFANFVIGLGKGVVFGIVIAMISCHFGLRIKPNTESLGKGTTSAVVSSITMVILIDAVFAIALQHVGWS